MRTDHEEDAAEPTTTAFDTAIITPNVARSASVDAGFGEWLVEDRTGAAGGSSFGALRWFGSTVDPEQVCGFLSAASPFTQTPALHPSHKPQRLPHAFIGKCMQTCLEVATLAHTLSLISPAIGRSWLARRS